MNFNPVGLFLGFMSFLSTVRIDFIFRIAGKLIRQRNFSNHTRAEKKRKANKHYQKTELCTIPNFDLYNTRVIPVFYH